MTEDKYQRVFPEGIFIFSSLNLLKRLIIATIWKMIVVRERNMSTPFAALRPSSVDTWSKSIVLILAEAVKKITTAKICVSVLFVNFNSFNKMSYNG